MPTYKLICQYCDHKWLEMFYQHLDMDEIEERCPKCKDTNIKIKKDTKNNCFYGEDEND